MPAKIAISVLGAHDADPAVGLLAAQLEEHDIAVTAARLREVVQTVVADANRGFILLAQADDRAIGIAYTAAHLSAEHGGVVGWLEELYVVPEWRGHGVGALLLAEITARAQHLHWRALELEVVAGHERAAALYLRHGFVPLARARYSRVFSAQEAAPASAQRESST